MDDLDRYIQERKKIDPEFAEGFDDGYENFKFGVLLSIAREQAGLSKEEMAQKLNTNKSTISRIENHSEHFRLSTVRKYAKALGKRVSLEIV
jgi:HTH-type transcriptional regulator / antitoxin HipB